MMGKISVVADDDNGDEDIQISTRLLKQLCSKSCKERHSISPSGRCFLRRYRAIGCFMIPKVLFVI